jgi:hypothetical protein
VASFLKSYVVRWGAQHFLMVAVGSVKENQSEISLARATTKNLHDSHSWEEVIQLALVKKGWE